MEGAGEAPRRVRGRRGPLLALALGLAAAPLAAELVYRLAREGSLGPTTHPALVRHDDELGWAYRPGARARHRTSEFDVEIAIDARGFRGDGWNLERPARRALVLGDSFAFGWGVEERESFCARIEAEAPEWEVLNAAVSGYGNDQQLLMLRRLVDQVRPDLVVCVFCPNDLYENRSRVAYGKHKPWFELVSAGRAQGELVLRGQPVPRPWLERVSHLYRALAKLAWEREFARTPRDPAAEWTLARAIFERMRAELDARVPLLLVSEEDALAEFAGAHEGIEHLDLRPVWSADAGPTRFPVDGHWNAHGHARVAEVLLAKMRELQP